MLDLRPNCELCDKDLPPDSDDAHICTYECTFCSKCVKDVLKNVCPNCGGGFTHRPIRPSNAHRPGVSLIHQPASIERVHSKRSLKDIQTFSEALKDIGPRDR